MSYATRWARVWSVIAALGVGLAMLEWSVPSTVIALVVATAVVAAVLLVLTNELWAVLGVPGERRHSVAWSLAIGSGVIATLALLNASPVLTLLVVVLAVGTSPPLVALCFPRLRRKRLDRGHRQRRARSTIPPPGGGGESPKSSAPSPAALKALSDQQLCYLWRHTFWDLHDEETLDERLATVAVRQACLEELERRDPAAFAAWLSSGARASGGPERFLHPRAGSDGTDVT